MAGDGGRLRRRGRRWIGLLGVSASRLVGSERGRVVLTVASLALAVATLVVIGGLTVGMATQGTVPADDVTYAVLPEAVDGDSPVAAFDNPQFGDAHRGAAMMTDHPGVVGASPVLVEFATVEAADGEPTRTMLVGVGADPHVRTVAGVNTTALDAERPYVAGDRDPADWTGEAVLSPGAADVLGYGPGEDILGLHDDHALTVTAVSEDEAAGVLAGTPVIVVHLAELQAIVGVEDQDLAHQFLVETTDEAAAAHIDEVYPQSTVTTQTALTASAVVAGGMPTAMMGMALVVAILVGMLFMITAMGLEVTADARTLATLAAMGISARSRLGILAVQTLLIGLVGGLVGVALGWVGIYAVNALLVALDLGMPIAVAAAWLAPLGIGVGILIGLVAIPYVAFLTSRMDLLEVLP